MIVDHTAKIFKTKRMEDEGLFDDYYDYDPGEEEEDEAPIYSEEEIEQFLEYISKKYDLTEADPKVIRSIACEIDLEPIAFANVVRKKKIPGVKLIKQKKQQEEVMSVSSISQKVQIEQHKLCGWTAETAAAEYARQKPHLNLVIIGHVDAGKSTLMGNLLVQSGSVTSREFKKIEDESLQIGRSKDAYAWVMAEEKTERERGVTIKVSMTNFETEERHFTILDCPGHRDFVTNMIAGTSMAHAALLVVEAVNPNLDHGQTREHLLICRALGVTNLVICINKMDVVNYDKDVFNSICEQLQAFLRGFGAENIAFIPTSAQLGENILDHAPVMCWYEGPTVIEALNNLTPPPHTFDNFVLTPFDTSDHGSEVVVVGCVDDGFVCVGDKVKIVPLDQIAIVKNIQVADKNVEHAFPGSIATILINTKLTSDAVVVGSALCSPQNSLPSEMEFTARVVTFDTDTPIKIGSYLVFHRNAADASVRVAKIFGLVDKNTKQITKKNPIIVPKNSCAMIHFELNAPLPLEVYDRSHLFGRFILRSNGMTVAFGSITSIGATK